MKYLQYLVFCLLSEVLALQADLSELHGFGVGL